MNPTDNKIMLLWFKNMSREEKLKLTYAVRLYSYRFDVYINLIYRNKVFLRSHLLSQANDVIKDIQTHNSWTKYMYSDKMFDNTLCKKKTICKSPFSKYIGEDEIKLSDFVNTLKKVTKFMHSVFSNPELSYVLQYDCKVYRALRFRKKLDEEIDVDKDINLELIGLTSTTYNISSALQFAFTPYGDESDYFDAREYKSVVLEITLPKGTHIIPCNICTIQNEQEILVISQGILSINDISFQSTNWWNKWYNDDGALLEPYEGNISYLFIQTNLNIQNKKLEYKSTIQISDMIENKYTDVIDDIYTSEF